MSAISAAEVKAAARGRWENICRELAPTLCEALDRRGHHVACPVHGGADGFRLFKDFDESGGGICNTCGTFSDGLALISWANGWSFSTTVQSVARVLGLTAPSGRGCGPVEAPKKKVELYGRIEAFGAAPFRFKANGSAAESFHLDLAVYSAGDDFKTRRSEVLWGRDLKRALEAAGACEGDWIEVNRLGVQEVKTKSGSIHHRSLWHVRKTENLDARRARLTAEAKAQREEDDKKNRRIEEVWSTSSPIRERDDDSAPVVQYLKRRSIFLGEKNLSLGDSLRAGPERLFFEDGRTAGRYPTLLAAVRSPEGEIVTLHQTVLTPEGFKAPLKAPKRIMPLSSGRTIRGGAIRLGIPNKVLAIAEGIETALSVTRALRIPCWATISASGMESFIPPEQVKSILIMADKDRSETGLKAAEKLKARLMRSGVYAEIILPADDIPQDAKGVDWNDVLTKGGVEALQQAFEVARTHAPA